MLAGEWNEPETHRFLRHITASVDAPLCFVDIGANIGAIALDAARLPGIRSVIAVEPDRRCVAAIEASCRLNGFTNVSVVSAAVSSKPGPVQFIADEHSFLSHVERRPESGADLYATWVAGLTLDGISADITDASIVLIDVEGSELDVLSGGIQFIRRLKPLIIFEYNRISRAHFDLEQVRSVLGPEYEIFRLNHNGRLDRELEVTWNCCAISKDTVFHERLSSFVES
jgi:FkbM family methyltransferase